MATSRPSSRKSDLHQWQEVTIDTGPFETVHRWRRMPECDEFVGARYVFSMGNLYFVVDEYEYISYVLHLWEFKHNLVAAVGLVQCQRVILGSWSWIWNVQFNTPGGVRRTGLCVRNRKVNYWRLMICCLKSLGSSMMTVDSGRLFQSFTLESCCSVPIPLGQVK